MDVKAYTIDLFRTALESWNAFFFGAADPLPLALVRVGVGLLLFWNVAVLGLDLRDFLGSDGWISPQAIQQYHGEHSAGAWSFWFWVSDRWLIPAWIACLAVTALFTLGYASRLTAVLAWERFDSLRSLEQHSLITHSQDVSQPLSVRFD